MNPAPHADRDHSEQPRTAMHTHRLRQAIEDSKPCPTCGGDRLRPDFTGSGTCHVGGTPSISSDPDNPTRDDATPASPQPGTSLGDGSRVEDLPEWERDLYLEQARVERYAERVDFGGDSTGWIDQADAENIARSVIALAEQEHAEKDATIAELRAEVEAAEVRAFDAQAALAVNENILGRLREEVENYGGFASSSLKPRLLAILDAPKDTTAPSEGGH